MEATKNNIRSFLFVIFIVGIVFIAQSGRDTAPLQKSLTYQDSYSVRETRSPQPLSLKYRVPYASVITRFVEQEAGDIIVFPEEAEEEYQEESIQLPDTRDAQAVLIYDVTADEDIFVFNEIQRWPAASLSKLMVALLAFEEFDMTGRVAITKHAVATEGFSGGFSSGEIFSVRDLANAIMIVSSNDAAVSLAEFYGYQNFIDLMNKRARELQMVQTNFFEPSGLSVLNQSSADDLKRLALYVYKNYPEIFLISQKKTALLYDYSTNSYHAVRNVNRYANSPTFLGGKTGYIDESRQNLISFFSRNNNSILVIILGATNRYAVGNNILRWLDAYYYVSAEGELISGIN